MKKIAFLSLVVMILVLGGCKGKEDKPAEQPETSEAESMQAVAQDKPAQTVAVQMVKCSVCGKEFATSDPEVASKPIKSCPECTEKNNEKMAQLLKMLDMMKSNCPKCGGSMVPQDGPDGVKRLVCTKCGETRDLKYRE